MKKKLCFSILAIIILIGVWMIGTGFTYDTSAFKEIKKEIKENRVDVVKKEEPVSAIIMGSGMSFVMTDIGSMSVDRASTIRSAC